MSTIEFWLFYLEQETSDYLKSSWFAGAKRGNVWCSVFLEFFARGLSTSLVPHQKLDGVEAFQWSISFDTIDLWGLANDETVGYLVVLTVLFKFYACCVKPDIQKIQDSNQSDQKQDQRKIQDLIVKKQRSV